MIPVTECVMAQSKTSNIQPGDSLVMRMWPPAGLAVGFLATLAWSGFLAYTALALMGLTP